MKYLLKITAGCLLATHLGFSQEPQEIPLPGNTANGGNGVRTPVRPPHTPAPPAATAPAPASGSNPAAANTAPPQKGNRIMGINNLPLGSNMAPETQTLFQKMIANQEDEKVFFRPSITKKEKLNILSSFQKLTNLEIERRIQLLEGQVAATTRKIEDPFGLGIDGIKPKPPQPEGPDADELARRANLPTLQNAIGTLKIRAIIPTRREFLSEGGQNIFEGDRIRLAFQGQEFVARVERVEETRIVFRDRITGDRAILPVNLSPPDPFSKGGSGGNAGYMTPMPPINPVLGRDD